MPTIQNVAGVVWHQCIGAKRKEKALIIADPSGERLEIGKALAMECPCECRLMAMKPTGMAGREPDSGVAKAMGKADIVVAPTEFSITHTKATATARRNGARVVTMPGILKVSFIRAIPVDYDEMCKTNKRLHDILKNGSGVRVRTKMGTDMRMGIMKGRRVANDNGITAERGGLNNLPAGEVAIAPKEGSSNGVVAFDLSSLNNLLDRPFKVSVRDGHAVSCEHKQLWKILSGVENGTNLAELGIGTNPKARVIGSILEDEKVRGTAHIAFGTSAALGGKVQTSLHLDSVFDKPTIEVDGKVVIEEGRFLF